jgi:hypothetical protein
MSLQNNKLHKIKKMKKKEINIRIEAEIKNKFKQICDDEKTTMSNKISYFILNEIKTNKKEHISKQFSLFVNLTTSLLDVGHITIIDKSMVNMSGDEIIDDDSKGNVFFTQTYCGDLIKFISENKDKKIYIYLAGCDIENNKFRLFTK